MASNRKVIFFVGTLGSGGLERFVSRVAVEGISRGLFDPVVVCLAKKEGVFLNLLEKNGVRVLQAPSSWNRTLKSLVSFRRLVKSEQATIIHSQVNFSLIQQWIVTAFLSQRFLVTERNMYPLTIGGRMRRILQFYFLKLVGVHYSANSTDVAVHLGRLVYYPAINIPVIPNGVDLPDLEVLNRNQLRDRLRWTKNDFVVGYVARFAEHKGQRYFVEVMHQVAGKLGRKLKLCFVGDGPTRNQVEELVNSMGLREQTVFVGIVANPEEFYGAFDCTALFSDFEGMPNVVIEAMSFGLPVIANPVGNVVELFEGGAGLLNRTRNSSDSAVAFIRLSENVDLRIELGRNARKRIVEKFSIENTLKVLTWYYGFGE